MNKSLPYFLALFLLISSAFAGEEGRRPLQPWLRQQRLCELYLRRLGLQGQSDGWWQPDLSQARRGPEALAEANELRDLLIDVVDSPLLTKRQRRVTHLWLDGFSFSEIGEELQCSESNARAVFGAAKRRVRSHDPDEAPPTGDSLLDEGPQVWLMDEMERRHAIPEDLSTQPGIGVTRLKEIETCLQASDGDPRLSVQTIEALKKYFAKHTEPIRPNPPTREIGENFLDWFNRQMALRDWDIASLAIASRFGAHQELKTIQDLLSGAKPLEEWDYHARALLSNKLERIFQEHPAAETGSLPRKGERTFDWVVRELRARQVSQSDKTIPLFAALARALPTSDLNQLRPNSSGTDSIEEPSVKTLRLVAAYFDRVPAPR